MKRFFDIVFKGLGIILMTGVLVFSALVFKSCSDTFEVMDEVKKEARK